MNRQLLKEQLKRHEDLKTRPYRCPAGKLTIGIGRNLDDMGITEAEAWLLLDGDIARCERELDAALPWWREMTEARQRALLDMCFNLGLDRLRGFKNALAAMERGDYTAAADGMLDSKWADQVGRRAIILASLMRSGK